MATCTATHTATHTATRTVPNPNSNISVVLEVIGQVPSDAESRTGWPRHIGCLKSQVIFHRRATTYRDLLWKVTHKDEASYGFTARCVRRTYSSSTFTHIIHQLLIPNGNTHCNTHCNTLQHTLQHTRYSIQTATYRWCWRR